MGAANMRCLQLWWLNACLQHNSKMLLRKQEKGVRKKLVELGQASIMTHDANTFLISQVG